MTGVEDSRSEQQAKMPTTLSSFAQRNPLVLFFLLAYLLAWIVWLPITLAAIRWIKSSDPLDITSVVLGSFAPTVSALLVQWLRGENLKVCRFFPSVKYFAIGLLAGLAIIAISDCMIPAIAMTAAPVRVLHWRIFLSLSAYQINWSTFLGGPVGEEPGWRSFALPRLQKQFGPLVASILLGILWALWHLPILLIPGSNPVWAFALILIGLSIIMTLGFNLSRGSVIVCIFMHAMFNTVGTGMIGKLIGNESAHAKARLIFPFSTLILPVVVMILTWGRLGVRKNSGEFA